MSNLVVLTLAAALTTLAALVVLTPIGPKDRSGAVGSAAVLVILASLLALMPLARHVDWTSDRGRPMYLDRQRVEWLEYQSIKGTGEAVALEVSDGQSVDIGNETFTPSPGVTVVVRTPTADSYCAQVSNQYGEISSWACLDIEEPPTNPDDSTTDDAE